MPPSKWTAHLTEYRSTHPTLTLKECMQGASKTYRRASSLRAPHSRIRTTSLTLEKLFEWVSAHPQRAISVFWGFQRPITNTTPKTMLVPSGRILKMVMKPNGDIVQKQVGTLQQAAKSPKRFIGDFVEMMYENGEAAEDEHQPVICEDGYLSSNCITPESYFRTPLSNRAK